MSNLVIGVGGTGKGVVTWLEYYLQRDFARLKNKFSLFVIDGPAVDPAYKVLDPLGLKGEIDFDLSLNERRAYQLSYDSALDIAEIKKGKERKFICDWLSKPDAEKITGNSFEPRTAGFGMSRAPAKACFYVEAEGMKTRLISLIGGIANLERVILVGSLIGGTGSGMLNEIAVLIRDILNDMALVGGKSVKLYGVTVLARGFEKVFVSDAGVCARNARCFAGIREIQRLLSQKNYDRQVSKNVILKNMDQLYDVSLIVDGNPDIPFTKPEATEPVNAIANAVANGILVIGSNEIGPTTVVWENSRGTFPNIFRSFGAHMYVYSPEMTMNLMSYLFVRDFYGRVISATGGNVENRVKDIFGSSKFTRMISEFDDVHPLPLAPPIAGDRTTFSELIINFSTSLSEFYESGLKISEQIENRGGFWGLGGTTNREIIDTCDNMWNDLFAQRREGTLNDTLNSISNEILDNFQQRIWEDLNDIFIDKQQSPPKPKDLQNYPGALKEAVDLLQCLETTISSCKAYFDHNYGGILLPKTQKAKQDAKTKLSKTRNRLDNLKENGKDFDDQDEYIADFEQVIYIEAWEIFMKRFDELLAKLQKVAFKYWNLFGAPAEGWFEYLKLLDQDCRGWEKVFRKKLEKMKDNLPFIRYLPRPYEAPLMNLYKSKARNHLNKFLSESHWSILKDQNTGQVNFYLSTPKCDIKNRDVVLTPFKNVITGEGYKSKVGFHHWKDIFDFCNNTIKGTFEPMDIWDAFAYDYVQWKSKQAAIPGEDDSLNGYAIKKFKHSKLRSKCLLPTSRPLPLLRFFFTGGTTGHTDEGKQVHAAFSALNIRTKESPIFEKMLLAFECNSTPAAGAHSLENWPYYSRCLEDYWKYNQNPDNTPIHICPEERNVYQIEKKLFGFTNEKKILHPSVVVHLGRMEEFRLFWLTYLSGIFGQWEKSYPTEPNRPHDYVITVTRNGQDIPVNLEQVGDYQSLMYNFLKRDKNAEDVREVIKDQWISKVSKMEDSISEITSWIGKFTERYQKIKLRPYMGKAQDTMNRKDLVDAIWISIWSYVNDIREVKKDSAGKMETHA
ncbi:MAG: tubulin-like doman-containing protein [Candidatus Eremiobacteraeota bacterium]|nr:tubulin-like doman-containing protein [Candidatus Eremiobacteraeota bacterium]